LPNGGAPALGVRFLNIVRHGRSSREMAYQFGNYRRGDLAVVESTVAKPDAADDDCKQE